MTIEFECGNCGKQLSTPDDKAGKTGKCPDCGEPVTVPQPQFAAETENPFAFEDRTSDFATSSSRRSTSTCPMCGGEVTAGERTCPSCGETLEGAPESPSEFSAGHKIDVGEVIGEAWKRFSDQMGVAIGAFVVLGIMGTMVNLVTSALQEADPSLAFVGGIISLLYNTWIGLGTALFMLTIARGERADIAQLFAGGKWFGRGLLAAIVFVLILIPLVIVCVLLVMGGVFVAEQISLVITLPVCFVLSYRVVMMFYWFQYVLVDTDAPGISCLARSREIMDGNYLAVFAIMIISILIAVAGFLMLCIGLLFTMPFAMVIWAMTYHHLSGGRNRRPGDYA